MITNAIALHGVRHAYAPGDRPVLAGLDLVVPPGAIWGLVGANGAGKTTTLRILATLLRPGAGRVEVCGIDVLRDPRAVRTVLGYMPDGARVDDRLTVEELLDFFAAAWGLAAPARRRAVDATLELCGLGAQRDRIVPELSKGLRQRVLLARTLLHDPKVLVLDEPASDLDPRARIELRALLSAIRGLGKTILLSSHILSELEPLCDGVAILVGGRVVAQGEIAKLARQAPDRVVDLRFGSAARGVAFVAHLARVLEDGGAALVGPIGGGRAAVRITGGDDALAALVTHLCERGLPPVGIAPRSSALEAAFLHLTAAEPACP